MSDVTDDIYWKARAAVDGLPEVNRDFAIAGMARAILAERERCADAVHRAAKDFYGNTDQMYAAALIASAIESGQ